MTIQQAMTELMARPDFIAVLVPDRVLYVGQTGAILDGSKLKRTYPIFNVRDLTAVTWQVYTREGWAQEVERIALELEARGVTNDR